jgi:carbon storage regulator
MLVFSRKVGERVVIEGGIVVQVLEVRGQRIRLGIEAPSEVGVWRGELSASEETAATGKRRVRKPR